MNFKAWMLTVKKIAYTYRYKTPNHIDLDDLCQIGMIALLKAIIRYKPDTGVPFEPYAYMRIRGAMFDVLRDNYMMPRAAYKAQQSIEAAIEELRVLNDFVGGVDIAEHMELTQEEYEKLRKKAQSHIGQQEEYSFELDPEKIIIEAECIDFLLNAIDNLHGRNKQVAIMYFLEHKSMKEAGKALGLCESRVSQLIKEIIESMEGIGIEI